MIHNRWFKIVTVCLVAFCLLVPPVMAKKKPSLDAWKPKFDPSGAKYKCVVSSVTHPVLKCIYAGFAIRDELWKRTNGQIYFDYFPLSILGGEVEVLNQLQMGAIQGMGVSSVASTNLGPRFGISNLPFLLDSPEKWAKFMRNEKLYNHFLRSMDHQGIMGVDIGYYGGYGWATTKPVKSLADAKKLKFRTAEAAVNQITYKSWGINAVAMPWPDVQISLKQGVIDGLDHAAEVCHITKKFEVCKHYTQVDYARGLLIWIFNKAWFKSLPADLQKIFVQTVKDVNAQYRDEAVAQEKARIEKAKAEGVQFYRLPDDEIELLRKQAYSVHQKYAGDINKLRKGDTYRPDNYLKEVQDFMDYEVPK